MTAPSRPRAVFAAAPLALRLLAMLVLIFAAAVLGFALVAQQALEQTRQRQIDDAQQHFAARIEAMEERWLNSAFALRQQVDLWQAGHAGTRSDIATDDLLRALMVTLLDAGDFSHVAVLDERGAVLFRHGTRSRQLPPLPAAFDAAGRAWTYAPDDRLVYRAVAGPVRYGERTARLVAFAPMDRALVLRLVYPNTQLTLRHEGVTVASSRDGAPQASSPASAGEMAVIERVWSEEPGAPRMVIERSFATPVTQRQLLAAAVVAGAAFMVVGWLVLGRWVQLQNRRLRTLQLAAAAFADDATLDADRGAQVARVAQGHDGIADLARHLRDMMARIEQAREREARARLALADVNTSLEFRVAERTRELEDARDTALRASRAKEDFLSNMSHELRTPMNGMLGALELLGHSELTPEQSAFLRVAVTSGEALLDILNSVLDFAKIAAGHAELRAEPLQPNALAASVTTLFSASARRKGLALRLEADPSLEGWRLGDALRIRQVLMNLVGNALKFTPQGEVLVRTQSLDGPDGARVAFEVADTGPGVPASLQAAIFEPFRQGESGADRRFGGTGLGLAICRTLAEAMGGTLGVDSAPGRGATFRFELPLPRAEGPAPASAAAPGPMDRLQGPVLLVEDNEVNRLVATAMLETLGLEVLQAADGRQALGVLAATPVRAVLMDCQMPVMDGYEATRRWREHERQHGLLRVPVIALTANALEGDAERCLAAGMDAHLGKPHTLAQLHEVLVRFLATAPAS